MQALLCHSDCSDLLQVQLKRIVLPAQWLMDVINVLLKVAIKNLDIAFKWQQPVTMIVDHINFVIWKQVHVKNVQEVDAECVCMSEAKCSKCYEGMIKVPALEGKEGACLANCQEGFHSLNNDELMLAMSFRVQSQWKLCFLLIWRTGWLFNLSNWICKSSKWCWNTRILRNIMWIRLFP